MYKAMVLTGPGGLDRLEVQTLPLVAPGPGEVRIRVRAAGAGATDLTMRKGRYPYAPKLPFTVGYEVVGDVESLGEGVTSLALGDRVCALTVYGAQAEYLTRAAEDFVKVPEGVSDADVIALVLNYVTAYQMIHRCTSLSAGQTALVTGARGGVGSALVELLACLDVRVVACSRARPPLASDAVDVAFDGLGGHGTKECIRATRKGGKVVGYGFMMAGTTWLALLTFWSVLVGTFLAGRRGEFYGITQRYRKDRAPFREDLTTLLGMLQRREISPKIAARLSLFDGVEAQRRLEAGGIDGKLVLLSAS